MLQLKMLFHLKVIFSFIFDENIPRMFSFIAFKRCVTTFLSRERECEQNNASQGNWSIADQGVSQSLCPSSFIGNLFSFSIKQRSSLVMYSMESKDIMYRIMSLKIW